MVSGRCQFLPSMPVLLPAISHSRGIWHLPPDAQKFKIGKFKSHLNCAKPDIDSVKQVFMKTELCSLIEKYPSFRPLNKPLMNDGN